MTDNGRTYDYPAEVRLEIGDQSIEDYAYAADVLNDGRYDVVRSSMSSASSAAKPETTSSRCSTGSASQWSQRCTPSCRNPRASKGL